MGFRLANRVLIEVDRMPENLSPRFNRDVSMSRGICIRDILLVVEGRDSNGVVEDYVTGVCRESGR